MSVADVPRSSKRELYEWGRGYKINEQPKLLPGKEVHTIACGGSHSVALLNDGTVYVWGDGRDGQLGLGSGVKKTESPLQVTALAEERVVGVWCGFAQTAAFTTSGTLYTWGFDSFCGPVYDPKVVQKYRNAHVNEVAFGPSMAIALMINRTAFPQRSSSSKSLSEVLVWGVADKGALGLGENVREQKEPTTIPQLSNRDIVKVSVGEFHAAAVTSRCEVFVWGLNEGETLGTFCGGIIWSPKFVLKLETVNVSNIVCGTNCTFALSTDGDVYSWGIGRHGVLGHGDEEDQLFPKKIESLDSVVGIASGGMHVVAWMEDGSVSTWGWGRDFKLGHSHDEDLFKPTHVEGTKGKLVLQVACGFDKTLALLETDLITVTYKQEVKTLPVYADTRVSDVIRQLSDHLLIESPVVLIDNNGQELSDDEKMRTCAKRSKKFFLIHRPSLWSESCDDLIFEGSPPDDEGNNFSIPTVAKATVDKLIFWLTHHSGTGQDFSRIFLLTYPNFLSPQEFLEKLIERYNHPRFPLSLHDSMAKDARRIIQLRVVNVLRKWIQGCYLDIMHEGDVRLVESIRMFIETDIQVEQPREAVFLRRYLTTKLSSGNISRMSTGAFKSSVDAPKSLPPDHPREMDLFKYPALEVARQLAIIEQFYFFSKIHPNEFVNLAWSQKDKAEKAPHILACIHRFNNFSEWCAAEILRGETHSIRVSKTERLIDIATESLKLRNLITVVAIVSSLGSSPIFRLRVWGKDGISAQHIEQLEELKNIVSFDGNMANYREHFDALPAPKIPFVGLSLQDITFLHDANPSYDANNLINFSKWNKIGNVIEKLVRVQTTPYNLSPIQPLINYLLSACGFESHESAAYKFSHLIEPDDSASTPSSVVVPPRVSKTFQCLYGTNEQTNRPLIEAPEIQVLDQRAKLILQNFQASLEPDRTAFWKSLVEKLAASSSRRVIVARNTSFKDIFQERLVATNPDVDCLSFREILCKSCVIECSIESVLMSFPSEPNQLQLFISLLKATLRSFLDVDKLVIILQELYECRLVREFRSVIVELVCCYKDMEIQSRHNRISAAVRALSRLQSKRKEFLKMSESLPRIDSITNELSFSAESIQHMYVQQQLLREKRLEYQRLFENYNGLAIKELCEFLEDLSKNIDLRIARRESEKERITKVHTAKIEEMRNQKQTEEARLLILEKEEKEILAKLEKLDRRVDKAARRLQTFDFFCENAAVRVDAEQGHITWQGTPKRGLIENYGSCSTALHTLSEVYVAQFRQKLNTEKILLGTQLHQNSESLLVFIKELASAQKQINEFLTESSSDQSRMRLIADDFVLYCDYQTKLLHFVPYLSYMLELTSNSDLIRNISKLLDGQQECLRFIRKK